MSFPSRANSRDAILWGGFAVALLDAANPCIFWAAARQLPPSRIFKSVASGLLGPAALERGAEAVWLGVFLHCFIALTVAAVYWTASASLPILVGRWAAVWGMAYGAGVFFVMNNVVLPFSGAKPTPWLLLPLIEHLFKGGLAATNASEWWFVSNFLGHIFLIGLPVALIARWFASRNRAGWTGRSAASVTFPSPP